MFDNKNNFKNRIFICAVGVLVCNGNVIAGGVDFSGMPVTSLFEEGTFFQASYTDFNVDFSGIDVTGQDTGSTMNDFDDLSFTYKQDINDDWSFMVAKYTSWYSQTSFSSGVFAGVDNQVDGDGLMGLVRYKINDSVAVHGGLNVTSLEGSISLPAGLIASYPDGYYYNNTDDPGYSYVIGGTYEIPEYHVMFGLTYFSKAKINTEATENGVDTGEFSYEVPDFVNFDFHFPVSRKDLVFGTIRWGGWNGYNITTPSGFEAVDSDADSITYSLGLAHQFSDSWVGLVRAGYEAGSGGEQSVDDYYDGKAALGLGATYTIKKTAITAFVTRIVFNEKSGGIGDFDDGTITAVTLSVRQYF